MKTSVYHCVALLFTFQNLTQALLDTKELKNVWKGLGWKRVLVISSPQDARTSLFDQTSAMATWIPLNSLSDSTGSNYTINNILKGFDAIAMVLQSDNDETKLKYGITCLIDLLDPFRLLIVTNKSQYRKHKMAKLNKLFGLYFYDTGSKELWSLMALAGQDYLIENLIEIEKGYYMLSTEKYNLQGERIDTKNNLTD